MEFYLCIIAIVTFGYSVFVRQLASTIITAPMICLGLGYLLSSTELHKLVADTELLNILATLALIMVLFSDACKTNLKALIRNHILPIRMLTIGLPLIMVIGAGVSWLFMPQWPIYAIFLVAAILAPTDAALGDAVVSNKNVPETERRALTVESGLNDGLALPFVLLFASYLAVNQGEMNDSFPIFISKQLVLGVLSGVIIGSLGAKIILWAAQKHFTENVYEGLAALGLAVSAYLVSELIGGNGFIGVFVAGLFFGSIIEDKVHYISEFVESDGQILVWATFFLIGLTLLPNALTQLSWPILSLILTSLFFVRPLAIYLCLIGTDTTAVNRLFLGWFGPRGLGTALYALLIVGEINSHYQATVLSIAINAVWISAFLHGITAAPLSTIYAKYEAKK